MNTLQTAITEATGWTLLHFLWQGTAIALVYWFILKVANRAKPAWSYAAGCLAMTSMITCAAVTFFLQIGRASCRERV